MAITPGNHFTNIIESVSVKCNNKLSDNKLLIKFCKTWRVILAEILSTLFLVLLGCLSCVPLPGIPYQPPLYAPLGFGFVVLFNIQAFAHISGAHMNPSVTLAAVLWGKMSIRLGIAYVIAQCVGSILGYGILVALSPIDLISDGICTTQQNSALTVYQALAIEVILTAALNFLNCALWDPKNEKSLESVALKFGFTIAGLSIAGAPLTGSSMNPARSLGPAVWTGVWAGHWIYWVGPLLGGALSALFYKYVWLNNKGDDM